jgi:hypothetical protein
MRIRLKGDLPTAAIARDRAVTPIDIPWALPGNPKEPNPRGGLRTCSLAGTEEEGRQGVRRDAVRDVREEGDHPTALLTKPKPALILTLPEGLPAQCAATPALARWRLILVHRPPSPALSRSSRCPNRAASLSHRATRAGWRAESFSATRDAHRSLAYGVMPVQSSSAALFPIASAREQRQMSLGLTAPPGHSFSRASVIAQQAAPFFPSIRYPGR